MTSVHASNYRPIFTLDLATCTGFCVGEPDERPTLGHKRLRSTGSDVGSFLIEYEEWLSDRVREFTPGIIVMEAPILASGVTPHVTRKLHAQAGITEMVARRAGIECCEVYPVTIKKALTGSGRSKKPEMVAAARAYGFDPQVPDEADAFGIWLCALRLRHPTHAGRWDILNFQTRRAS